MYRLYNIAVLLTLGGGGIALMRGRERVAKFLHALYRGVPLFSLIPERAFLIIPLWIGSVLFAGALAVLALTDW